MQIDVSVDLFEACEESKLPIEAVKVLIQAS